MAPPSPKSSRPNDKATPSQSARAGSTRPKTPSSDLSGSASGRPQRAKIPGRLRLRRRRPPDPLFVQHRLFGAGLRTVERQWHARWTQLRATTLDTTTAPTTATLAERARCVRILGAPVPTVWCLNEEASLSGQWPTITPLGTSHGDMHHLPDTQGLE